MEHIHTRAFVLVGTLGATTRQKKEEKKDARAQDTTQKKKTKSAKISAAKNPPPKLKDTDKDSEEEVAMHLKRVESLTGHFTKTNASTEEDD